MEGTGLDATDDCSCDLYTDPQRECHYTPRQVKSFAVENISELFGYLATGRVNIRIHRDITGEMWFGVDKK